MTTGNGRSRLRGAGGALLGLGIALALLWPEADRRALVAQGVGHLLAADLERSQADPDAPAVFAALARMASGPSGPPRAAWVGISVDGLAGRGPRLERAVTTQWNRFREGTPVALPDPSFEGAPGPGDLALRLRVDTAGERVDLSAEVSLAGERRALGAGGSWRLPDRASLLPPLLAVACGLAFGRTLLALFVGIYAGSVVMALGSAGPLAPLQGLWDVFFVYLRRELFDDFRLEILGFIAALIAMVAVITRAGGLHGLMDRLLRTARTARSALLLANFMGLAIFFDDYANCMLVGSTMRPITDRLRVAREKLAYVVDSTAAPVAAISLVSTWIAFQVSVYAPQLPGVGIRESGYELFIETLPYRFYCWLTLFFVTCVIVTGRDFGPMARAERRARTTGAVVRPGGRPPISDEASRIEPEPHMPRDWRLAAIPVALTAAVTAWRIFADGGGLELWRRDPAALLSLSELTPVLLAGSGAGPVFAGGVSGLLAAAFLAASNAGRLAIVAGTAALLGGGGLPAIGTSAGALGGLLRFGLAAGVVGALARRAGVATSRPCLPLRRLVGAAFGSARTLGFAVVLLFEAWMIGAVCRDLSTADYLVALLSDALPPGLLPLLLFALSCLVAFATGSSWSTMSILLPNVVGLAASLGAESPLGTLGMVALCISAVLEGAVFGDHCSPISDTTVLSSVASGSDHIDHVITQAPYAAAVAGAAVVFGYLPLLWLPAWGALPALAGGAGALLAGLLVFGERAPEPLAANGIVP